MQAVEQKLGDQQNKRISGFRKSSETIKGNGQQDHLHRSGLFREHWRTIAMLLIYTRVGKLEELEVV